MRRGDARRGAPPAMRPAVPPLLLRLLLLLLLAAGSCRGGASSTSASSATSVTSGVPTTVKSSTVASGTTVSSTSQQITSKAFSSTAVNTLTTTAKRLSPTTTKATQKTTLGTITLASTESAPKGTTIKPPSSVAVKTTQQTTDAAFLGTPTVTPSLTSSGPKTGAPSASGDSSGTVKMTPSPSTQSKATSSSTVPTVSSNPDAHTSHTHSATAGHSSGVASPGSAATPAKGKPTDEPGAFLVRSTVRPGPTAAGGAVPTTGPKSEGKKDSATTQVSSSSKAPATPDSSCGTTGTTRGMASSTEHHVLSATSGTHQTPFQAQSKIVCTDAVPSKSQRIVMTFNESRTCDSVENSPLKEPLLKELCKAVKSSFNQSRDDCTVKLASVEDDHKKVAVIDVSVTTYSVDDELAEYLVVKKGELEKLGLTNLTYGEKLMDLDTEDRFGMPLIITIVCMAASLLLVAAIYGCCHQRISRRKDQQRLTEELQTMENGYHDNPTLEVMETSAEMQEKKVNLNGELADSWIVPMDSLTKEDLEEEEDTHL